MSFDRIVFPGHKNVNISILQYFSQLAKHQPSIPNFRSIKRIMLDPL